MLWAFFLGLGVDLFSDTPGMNAASAVLLAFLRPHLLRLFAPRDLTGNFAPSARTMGTAAFLKYAAACVLLHHTVLISLDYFSAAHVGLLALHILASTVLTLACTLAVEGIRNKGL